jgi:cytochrome c biogenesis protein CcdA
MKDQTVNPLTRIGIWITVIAAAIWAGDHIVQAVVDYIPYAIGLGILLMAAGLFLSARKARTPDKK